MTAPSRRPAARTDRFGERALQLQLRRPPVQPGPCTTRPGVAPVLATAQDLLAGDEHGCTQAMSEAIHLLETWLESRIEYHDIPGISAGIVHDQQLVWSKGFGSADVERHSPATAQTIYRICSISKLFTSVAVMQERDAGRLRLDDPVSHHLPWFNMNATYEGGAPVRVERLLTHSSGLPREADFAYWSGPDFRFPTREEVKAKLAEQSTLYPAERWYNYSTLGIMLAGEIVAATSGMPYDAYARTRILDPLGMTSTTPEIPVSKKGKRLATGAASASASGAMVATPLSATTGPAPDIRRCSPCTRRIASPQSSW